MKRPLHRRAAALLWALAFVLGTVGDGFGLRACPHHDSASPPSPVPAPAGHEGHHAAVPGAAECADAEAAGSGGGHHQRAPDGHDEHSPGGQHEHSPGGHHDGPCTCDAACQAATGAALPGSPQGIPGSATTADGAAPPRAADDPRLSRPPHFLPFSLAPPRVG